MERKISQLKDKDLNGKVVIVRIDTNVPVEEGLVTNDFRLRSVLPTFEFLLNKGARVVVIGHREPSPEATLEPVANHCKTFLPVSFIKSSDPENVRASVGSLESGKVLFLENLRSLPYEKENDEDFARALASLGDVFINEAFSVSHREHASIVGVTRFLPSFAGLCFEKEVRELSFAFSPERPFLFILGGLKFKTKAPLIEKFLSKADTVFVGGALANSFFKEKGWEIGASAYDDGVELGELLEKDKLFLPTDVVVEDETGNSRTVESRNVLEKDSIVDVGPRTLDELSEKISSAKLIVWNGPMGNTEKGFSEQTHRLAQSIADSEAYSLIGGGDTIASIDGLGLDGKFSFVSTGGGAMLDFLVHETLPGIEALNNSPEISF